MVYRSLRMLFVIVVMALLQGGRGGIRQLATSVRGSWPHRRLEWVQAMWCSASGVSIFGSSVRLSEKDNEDTNRVTFEGRGGGYMNSTEGKELLAFTSMARGYRREKATLQTLSVFCLWPSMDILARQICQKVLHKSDVNAQHNAPPALRGKAG